MSDDTVIRVDGVDRPFTRRRILAVLLIPLSMSLMAMSAVNVALPTIELGLGATATDIQWVLSGYGLAFGMSLIPAGRLGDANGRGAWFVAGVALFTLGSTLCAFAPTPLVLNLFRLVQGVGSGFIGPQTTGMIMKYFSGADRARAFSLFGLVVSVSVAVGPILSGAVIDAVGPEWGWRAAFAINVPLGLVALGLALRWLPFEAERLRRQGRALGVRPPRADLDPLGAGLISLAVLCLMTPFIVRGSPLLWLLLPAGLLLLVVWALWERRYVELGREPMVRMDLFLHRSFSVQTAVAAVQFLGGASVMAVLAIFLQQSLGATALATGLVTLPNAIASAATSVWAGRHALTRGRSIIVAALATNVIGLGLTGALAPLVTGGTLHYLWLAAPLTLSGAAFGAFGSINQTLALQDVPIRNGGSAGAVKQTAERTSAAMGNAIVTGLFFAVAAAAGQTVAFVASFGLVAVFMSAALAIAASDLRSSRRA